MSSDPEETTPDNPEEISPEDDKKRKMYIGLDLGTLNSCILPKLSKPGSDEHHGIWVPTVVGYPEDGILAGIYPVIPPCFTVMKHWRMNCICV